MNKLNDICPKAAGCIVTLDALVVEADDAGGCEFPAGGNPSGALAQYREKPGMMLMFSPSSLARNQSTEITSGVTRFFKVLHMIPTLIRM